MGEYFWGRFRYYALVPLGKYHLYKHCDGDE